MPQAIPVSVDSNAPAEVQKATPSVQDQIVGKSSLTAEQLGKFLSEIKKPVAENISSEDPKVSQHIGKMMAGMFPEANIVRDTEVALTGPRTGKIPENSDLAKSLQRTPAPQAHYSSRDNLWSVKNKDDTFSIFAPDGKLLSPSIKAGGLINVNNPDTSIGQSANITIGEDGVFKGREGATSQDNYENNLKLTGKDGTYAHVTDETLEKIKKSMEEQRSQPVRDFNKKY